MELTPTALSLAQAAMREEHSDGWGARPEASDKIIAQGWRRWCSYERRHKKRKGTFEERVEDLAKGLCSRLHPPEYPVGRDMEEYRWLASTLGRIFADSTADSQTD